jgi:hypothetical protein
VADLRWRDAWEKIDYPRREFARRSASLSGIRAIVRLARSEPGISVSAEELDEEGTP